MFNLVCKPVADESVILRKIDSFNSITDVLTKALNHHWYYTHALKLLQLLEESEDFTESND